MYVEAGSFYIESKAVSTNEEGHYMANRKPLKRIDGTMNKALISYSVVTVTNGSQSVADEARS